MKQTLQRFIATLPHQRKIKRALYQVCLDRMSITDGDRIVIGQKLDRKA